MFGSSGHRWIEVAPPTVLQAWRLFCRQKRAMKSVLSGTQELSRFLPKTWKRNTMNGQNGVSDLHSRSKGPLSAECSAGSRIRMGIPLCLRDSMRRPARLKPLDKHTRDTSKLRGGPNRSWRLRRKFNSGCFPSTSPTCRCSIMRCSRSTKCSYPVKHLVDECGFTRCLPVRNFPYHAEGGRRCGSISTWVESGVGRHSTSRAFREKKRAFPNSDPQNRVIAKQEQCLNMD